jgi:Protein of unknown function (DUF3570)
VILIGRRRVGAIAGAWFGLVAVVSPARGEDDPLAKQRNADPQVPAETAPPKPQDTSTKHVSFEVATYADTDNITVFTPSVNASVENVTAGTSIRGSYLVDVVSAASVDIVSTASRRWNEARQAGTLELEYKPRDFGILLGSSLSSEPDYFSYGVGLQMTKDFNEKNTTLIGGFGYGHDTIGRAGTPFAVFSRTLVTATFNGGITQVINRSTVGSIVGDIIIENGDQSKPYRYIPMFAANVAPLIPNGASIDFVTLHRLPERPLEQLPLQRQRYALTSRLAHRFEASTLRLEERVYWDTWALVASSTDLRWIFDVSRRVSFWPHARFHVQDGVSFWQKAYVSGSAPGWDLPEYRTGDRELGPLWTTTGGGGLRFYLGKNADPRTLSISVTGDVMYTSFLDDLYLTARTGGLGALTLEGEL